MSSSESRHLQYTDIEKIHSRLIDWITWFYMILYIDWRVISSYVLHSDGAARTVVAFATVALILNLGRIKDVFFSRGRYACLLWFTLSVYTLFNSFYHGAPSNVEVVLFYRNHVIEPLVFLMITTCALHRHREETLKVIFGALLFFVLMAFLFSAESSTFHNRIINESIGNTNSYFAFCLVFVSCLLYSEKEINWALFVPVVLFASIVILMAATRSAFLAVIMVLVGFLFSLQIKNKPLFFGALIVVAVALYLVVSYVVENTLLGQRVTNIRNENEVFPVFDNPWLNILFNDITGDRAFFYYKGGKIFAEHPIFGIGLYKFKDVSGYYLQIHSEYMIHLCENGLIGFSLFVSYYVVMGLRLFRAKIRQVSHPVMIACFAAILFINLISWTYCTIYYMIIYAVILNTIYPPECKVVEIEDEVSPEADLTENE